MAKHVEKLSCSFSNCHLPLTLIALVLISSGRRVEVQAATTAAGIQQSPPGNVTASPGGGAAGGAGGGAGAGNNTGGGSGGSQVATMAPPSGSGTGNTTVAAAVRGNMASLRVDLKRLSTTACKNYLIAMKDKFKVECEPMNANSTFSTNAVDIVYGSKEKCEIDFSNCGTSTPPPCGCEMKGLKKVGTVTLQATNDFKDKKIICVWKAANGDEIEEEVNVGDVKAKCTKKSSARAVVGSLWLTLVCLVLSRLG